MKRIFLLLIAGLFLSGCFGGVAHKEAPEGWVLLNTVGGGTVQLPADAYRQGEINSAPAFFGGETQSFVTNSIG